MRACCEDVSREVSELGCEMARGAAKLLQSLLNLPAKA